MFSGVVRLPLREGTTWNTVNPIVEGLLLTLRIQIPYLNPSRGEAVLDLNLEAAAAGTGSFLCQTHSMTDLRTD